MNRQVTPSTLRKELSIRYVSQNIRHIYSTNLKKILASTNRRFSWVLFRWGNIFAKGEVLLKVHCCKRFRSLRVWLKRHSLSWDQCHIIYKNDTYIHGSYGSSHKHSINQKKWILHMDSNAVNFRLGNLKKTCHIAQVLLLIFACP